MSTRRLALSFAVLCSAPLALSCDDFWCGYGGPGCSDPWVGGLCEGPLVTGRDYLVVFGYGSDTGLSEATVLAVESDRPEHIAVAETPGSPDVPKGGTAGRFDLNNGTGNGGITLTPRVPGEASLRVTLKGWKEPWEIKLTAVAPADAPATFVDSPADARLARCLAAPAGSL